MDIKDVGVYIGRYEFDNWTWRNIQNYPLLGGSNILYRKCVGLEDIGKPKNIYIETNADSDFTRIFFPTKITYEATKITLDLVVKRNNNNIYISNELSDVVRLFASTSPTVLWDTVRNKMAIMALLDAATPNKDSHKNMKYLEVELTFSNLMGYCPYIKDTFINGHLPIIEAAALPIIKRVLS